MRATIILVGFALVLASAYALDVNTVSLTSPSNGAMLTADFNVSWDVNNANSDWNYFIIVFTSGTCVFYDGDYNWSAPVFIDFNVGPIDVNGTGGYCDPDTNDPNIIHCAYLVNVDNNFLRDGKFSLKVVGWKLDGNYFESNSVSPTLDYFNEFNASVSGFSSSGEMNVTLSFECDVNTSSASVVLHTSSGDVSLSVPDANNTKTIVLTVAPSDLNKVVRGTILEVNSGFSSACPLPNDTNTLVTNLPDAYFVATGGSWSAMTIPYVLDENYSYTIQALSDANTVARYAGGWDTNVSDFYSEPYTFYGYYVYADSNHWIPLRWSSYYNKSSCKGGDYVTLSTGWNFISAYCLDGTPSCADSNSSLVTLSFLEVNNTSMEVYKRPLYQFYGESNAPGSAGTLVSGFGAFNVTSASPYWVWINPNWVQSGFTIYYYGACVSVPNRP